jgi:diguanylate cyclase (GGDEF)-like protein
MALTEELGRAVARHARSRAGFAVLFCDLDGFKPVNDRGGHAAGDAVLVQVAERLRQAVRDVDFVARLGGDEFVVLCEGTGAEAGIVEQVCARLHELVERPLVADGGVEAALGLSIGVAAVGPDATAQADELLLLSDQEMYEAKAAGPGGTRVRWVDAPS